MDDFSATVPADVAAAQAAMAAAQPERVSGLLLYKQQMWARILLWRAMGFREPLLYPDDAHGQELFDTDMERPLSPHNLIRVLTGLVLWADANVAAKMTGDVYADVANVSARMDHNPEVVAYVLLHMGHFSGGAVENWSIPQIASADSKIGVTAEQVAAEVAPPTPADGLAVPGTNNGSGGDGDVDDGDDGSV